VQEDPVQFSERLGALTRAQLQAALDRFSLGKLLGVRAPAGGLFGQNLFLTTESGEWVFRGAPHWFRGAPHPTWQFAKERWFAERIHGDTSAPVPWPYLVETSSDLFGWAWALMPRMPGECAQFARHALSLGERLEMARAMGEALAELHALRAPAPGDYDPDLDAIQPDTSLRSYALRVLQGCRERALAPPSTLEAADLALIERVVRETEDTLDVPVAPSCIHLDYHWGNLNVARRDGAWRVTGIFDLMGCEFGDPEMDLSRPAAVFATDDRPLLPAFLDAYRARRPLRPGARERFRFFMLIDRLIIWSFGKRTQSWFGPEARFRDFARFYLDLDSQLEVKSPPDAP
jgi:aminoglycoside phosphotransferase (APT) family kinase protein